MNRMKNGSAPVHGLNRMRAQQAGKPQQPGVVQPQTARSPQVKQPPVAPPVYRPQSKPQIVQRKPKAVPRLEKPPAAPPVYRTQPVPKVLQTKMASGQQAHIGQTPRRPVAPHVYRPEAKKIVQPKAISQLRKAPAAPPVYRPEQKGIAQPKMASAPDARKSPKAPSVYLPRLPRLGVQAKMAGSLLLKKPPVAPRIYRSPQPVLQAYGTLNIPEDPSQDLKLSSEDTVRDAAPDDFVIVARIITPTQRKPQSRDVKTGLFVSLSKMMVGNASNNDATAPLDDIVAHYVSQHRDVEGVKDLIEFTTNPAKVGGFAKESNLSYTVLVKIKKKYLTSSKSAEGGWMAKQDAPYEIVAGRKDDIHAKKKDERMSHADIETARQAELDAEFMEQYQGKGEFMGEEFAKDPEKRQRYVATSLKYIAASKTE